MSAPYWLQAADVNHVDENRTKIHLWINRSKKFIQKITH